MIKYIGDIDEQIENDKDIKEQVEKEFKYREELDELKKDAIIDVSSWGAGGFCGTFITKKKELYTYEFISLNLTGKDEKNYILKNRDLNDDEYNKVTSFIENEILNKNFKNQMLFDTGFNVTINYKGVEKTIENDVELDGDSDSKIYNKAEKLMNELLK